MKKSRSSEVLDTLCSRKGIPTKTFLHQQEFQTQSSVYEYYQKARTKQDAYRSKIQATQKKLCQILAKYNIRSKIAQNVVQQQKMQISRLQKKHQQQNEKQRNSIIFCKNQIEQIQCTLEYFQGKLREYHDLLCTKTQQHFEEIFGQLENRLKLETQSRKSIEKQIISNKQFYKERKQQLISQIAVHAKLQQSIQNLQQNIEEACQNFKQAIQQNKIQRQRDYHQAKEYVIELNRTLIKFVQDERLQRQLHKEQILQAFERLLINSNLYSN